MFHARISALSILAATVLLTSFVTHSTQAIAPADPYADELVSAMFTTDAQNAVGAPDGNTATLSSTLGSGIELDMGTDEEGTGDLILHYSNSMLGTSSTTVSFLDASKNQIAQQSVNLPITGMAIGTARVTYTAKPTPYRYIHIGAVLTSYSLDAIEAATYRPDSDNDGMPDQWELDHGLDPLDPDGDNGPNGDPDGDGLTNAQERTHGTHPKKADTDGDGLPDKWEIECGLDPLDPNGPNGPDADPDGDGLTNLEEYRLGRNPSVFDNIKYFLTLVAADTN